MTDQGSYVALAASWADDPWFRFPRAFIRDSRLSATARAIAAWMASHSTRFRFDVATMMKAGLGGRDKIRKALKELEKHGYLVRTRERNSDGTMGRILYELHPIPQENPSSAPATENQSLVPGPENQSLAPNREDTTKPQFRTGDWKPGPGFQEGYKGEQPQVEQEVLEGEEGAARVRAMGEPSPVDEPRWGVAGGAGFAAPSLASAELIRDIAARVLLPGEGLTAADHQRLAMLAEAARSLVDAQPGLSWDEYVAWLKQGWVRPDGRRTFKSLPGALGWRLLPEQIRGQAWAWACEQRGAQEPSEARGTREAPPGGVQVHASACGRHKVALTDDGKCLRCESEEAAEWQRLESDRAAATAAEDEGQGEDASPELEELDPALLEQMYTSLRGAPATDEFRRAREQLEADRRQRQAADLTGE